MESIEKLVVGEMGFDKTQFSLLERTFKPIRLDKKGILLREGEHCSFLGFIQQGTLRSYILKEGNECNIDFYFPDSFVSSYTSFLMNTPSVGFIQALSPIDLIVLEKEDFMKLLALDPIFYRFGKYISDRFFIKKCKRESSLLMDSATERFKFLLTLYPQIEQSVPQYHIASYLGIKPESLSRLKQLLD